MKEIYDWRGEKCLRTEEAIPVCGEAFCDACGDCLHCYGGDECLSSPFGTHRWIEYEDLKGTVA